MIYFIPARIIAQDTKAAKEGFEFPYQKVRSASLSVMYMQLRNMLGVR